MSVGQCLKVVDLLSQKGYIAMAICDGSSAQQWHLEVKVEAMPGMEYLSSWED